MFFRRFLATIGDLFVRTGEPKFSGLVMIFSDASVIFRISLVACGHGFMHFCQVLLNRRH
jgi:hypothetical protein